MFHVKLGQLGVHNQIIDSYSMCQNASSGYGSKRHIQRCAYPNYGSTIHIQVVCCEVSHSCIEKKESITNEYVNISVYESSIFNIN